MVIALLAVDVYPCFIACVTDGVAKGGGTVGQVGVIVAVGAGILCPHILPVEVDRQLQLPPIEEGEDIFRLLAALLCCEGLGEEVDTHIHAVFPCACVVGLESIVRAQRTCAVAAVADAEDGEVDILGGLGPVHPRLVGGEVNATLHGELRAHIVGMTVQGNKVAAEKGVHGDALNGGEPNHICAVVDIDLPFVGVNGRRLGVGAEGAHDQNHTDGQDDHQ